MQKSRRNNDTLLQIHLATIIEHSSIPRKNGGKVQIPVKEKPRSYHPLTKNYDIKKMITEIDSYDTLPLAVKNIIIGNTTSPNIQSMIIKAKQIDDPLDAKSLSTNLEILELTYPKKT